MSQFKNQHSEFRHRGFKPADPNADIVMIFGNEAAPLNPDGTEMLKLWDHDVVSQVMVGDHVEEAQALPPEAPALPVEQTPVEAPQPEAAPAEVVPVEVAPEVTPDPPVAS